MDKRYYAFIYMDDNFLYDIYFNKYYLIKNNKNNIYSQIPETNLNSFPNNYLIYKNCLKKTLSNFKPSIDLIYIYLTNKCNLECSYCYVKNENNKENKELNIDKFIKNIDKLENYFSSNSINVRFFGGEPLLQYDKINNLINFFNKKYNINSNLMEYSISTNGTIFNENIMNLIKNYKIKLKVTLDGNKKTHDKFRIFSNYEGSYDIVKNNIINLINNGFDNLTVSMTIGNYNLKIYDYIKEFLNIGVKNIRWQLISNNELQIKSNNVSEIKYQLSILAQNYVNDLINGKFYNITNFTDVMQVLIFNKVSLFRCKAGIGSMAIDTDGKIYICQRFINSGKMEIGDINIGINKEIIKEIIYNSSLENLDKCKNCWIKFYCVGQCYYNNYYFNNNFNKPNPVFCEIIQEYFKIGIWIINSLIKINRSDILKKLAYLKNYVH